MPTKRMAFQLKPLYISAHFDRVLVRKVLVGTEAKVNILPSLVTKNLKKSSNELILTKTTVSGFVGDTIRSKRIIPLQVRVREKVWVAIFFMVETTGHFSAFLGRDWIHGSQEDDAFEIKEVELAPTEMDDSKAEVQDPLLEINLETEDNYRPIYISRLMEPELHTKMEELLREFKDCFAWDYTEIHGFTPEDEYLMPMADLLIDGAAKHEISSFVDGHSGYNQIFKAEDDVHKTTFICPSSFGTFERFIANSARKFEPFSSLQKLKDEDQFTWEEVHQKDCDAIEEYLSKPPVLIPPK
ncbi:hypothetical protein L3X38_042666 [Prunus dulcis]|uniref:Reverse transcriptase domain-containing protein n=1 Tax=Prunus dulcis TaxID=3755 RepID=A0AAD4UVA1_PRUDU|nr:hypothetical protein L3X38_042666 [Prunus dulcis]